MKKMMKILSLALTLVMTVSLLAACGSKDSGKQKLIVGFDAEFPPYGFLAADGSYDGFDLAMAEELMAEVLLTTDFNQPQRIREILLQTEMESQQMAMGAGHRFAAMCAQAHFSAQAAVNEATSGYTALSWVHDFVKNFDQKIASFTDLSQQVLAKAVCVSRLTLGITEDSETDLSGLVAKLPAGEACADASAYATKLPKKLGIKIPAQVSFAGLGCHLDACGKTYNGTLQLMANILSLSYLWNAVRVQGGAYGAGMQAGRTGSMFCYSFRDPTPGRTLNTFRSMASFLKEFRNSGEQLDKFIISTISNTEPLAAPRQLGGMADGSWFAGFTYDDAIRERKELLNADWDQLLAWCDMLEQLEALSAVCVVGHSEALNACEAEGLTLVDL